MSNIIKLSDIQNSKNKRIEISIEETFEDIETKAPIKADFVLEDIGEFIKVSAKASGVAFLTCDLCLEKFEYKIDLDIDELFVKSEIHDDYGKEIEIKDGQFYTDLAGADEIDISDILYQSVILDFPNKKVCDINCKGGDIFIRDENSEHEIDPRMAIFKDIKIERK